MTDTNDKLRSLFLAGLMVFSVFAMTVSFAGGAAAAGNTSGPPDIRKATHFVDSSGSAQLEVAFDEDIETTGSTEVTVGLENGTEVGPISVDSNNENEGQLLVATGAVYNNVQNVTVTDIEDVEGNSTDVTADVRFAPSTLDTSSGDNEAFRGSNVALTNGNLEATFDIDGQGIDRTRGTGINSQVYVLDTDNLDLGDYNVSDGTNPTRTLTLNDLGLEVSSDEDTFETDEDVTATVTSDAIDREVEADLLDSDDEVVAEDSVTIDSDGQADLDFGTVDDTGNYTVEVEDVNTGVTATSDEFSIVDAGTTSVDFGASVVEEDVGDVAEITVNMQNTDTATVQVGDESDDNYFATAEVVDGNGDGQVTVEFNSYTAGSGSTVLTAADSDDEINNVTQGGSFTDESRAAGVNILDATDYDVLLEEGEKTATKVQSEDAVATLSLQERSTDNVQIWTAPADQYSNIEGANASDVYALVGSNNVTQTDTIATGAVNDTIIVQVEASGLEGPFAGVSDLGNAYQSESGDTNPAFVHEIEEAEAGANEDAATYNIDALPQDSVDVIYDEANDTHFVAIDSEAFVSATGAEDGDEFVANFTVTDNTELAEENQSVSDTFAVADADATLNGGNDVTVAANSGQAITGETNLAPGTDVTVRVRSTTSGSPFLKQPSAVVQPDGTFSATADFSDVSPGANFTAQTRVSATNVGDAIDGTVGAAPSASVSISDQESAGETVVVDSATLSEGGFIAIHNGSATGDVIGASSYLEAGSHEDVEVTLDTAQDEDFTAVAMPHLDTDGDQTYDFPDNDGPYTANGSAVTDSAAVTIVSGEETTTEEQTTEEQTTEEQTTEETTEEATTMETTTEETTTTGDSGPGFTAVIALVALVAAALLAVRRDN